MSTATLTGLRDYLYVTMSADDMLWLGTQLTEQAKKTKGDLKPYTMEEINSMLDEAEAEIAAGIGIPHEDVMREWKDEITREEQEELELAKVI